jgi:hypothetical protein
MPVWLLNLVVGFGLLLIAGSVFALIVASRVPNAATGHIYMIYMGRSAGQWYLEFWQYVIYETLTWAAMTVFAFAALYMGGKTIWFRYYRWPPMPKSSDS